MCSVESFLCPYCLYQAGVFGRGWTGVRAGKCGDGGTREHLRRGQEAMRRRGPPCPLVWNAKIIIPARGSRRMTAHSIGPLCTTFQPCLPCSYPPWSGARAGARPRAAGGPPHPLPGRQRVRNNKHVGQTSHPRIRPYRGRSFG